MTEQADNKAVIFTVPPDSKYTGVMIALYPPPAIAQQIAAISGVQTPAEELHVTLTYMPNANLLPDVQIAGAIVAARKISMCGSLTGHINGTGRFNASTSSDGQDVIFGVVDVPKLDYLRAELMERLSECGCESSDDHGYTPHMTLAYIEPGSDSPVDAMPTIPLRFDAISIAVGGKRIDFPMMNMEEDTGKSANALKAIGRTENELRVANYMVLFGGRDLEGVATSRKNGNGSTGEFFTKSTSFESPYTQTGVLHVDWEHSAGAEGLGSDDILGYVDWKTARIDDRGLFVERVLNRRNQYVQWVEELISAGLIGNSTEAVSDGVLKADDGEIKAWPLRRDTLTVSPMEPRMLSQNAVIAIKALSGRYPALKNMLTDTPDKGSESEPEPEALEPETGGPPVAHDAVEGSSNANVGDAVAAQTLSLELDLLLLED